MTFSAFEASTEGSRPVEVYDFHMSTTDYRYTSAEDSVVIGVNTFLPETISRTKIGQSREENDNDIVITVPATNEFARLFINSVPGQRCKVTVQRVQRSDFPSPEVITLFQGYVRGVGFSDQAKVAKISVMPLAAAASRPVPRFVYSSQCNHVLGDAGCKINLSLPAFHFGGTISAASGNTITVPGASGYPDGFFSGGYVEALSGLDARLILSHTGNTLQLLLPFPFTAVGQVVTLFAGCDHTAPTCKSKFDNVLNYGGFPFVPTKNPFETGVD